MHFDLTNIKDVWSQNLITTYDTNSNSLVSSDWIKNRFDGDGKFNVKNRLRFEQNYEACTYDEVGEKEVSIGCVFEADDFLRHPNIDSTFDFWNLRDILPNTFPSGSDGFKQWSIFKTLIVDLDNDNFTVQVQDANGGGYIPPSGEGLLEQSVSDISIQEQENIYLVKTRAELENVWQKAMLSIIDVTFGVLLLGFYLFSGFVLLFYFFGSFPLIFSKFHEKLNKLTDINLKRGYR